MISLTIQLEEINQKILAKEPKDTGIVLSNTNKKEPSKISKENSTHRSVESVHGQIINQKKKKNGVKYEEGNNRKTEWINSMKKELQELEESKHPPTLTRNNTLYI